MKTRFKMARGSMGLRRAFSIALALLAAAGAHGVVAGTDVAVSDSGYAVMRMDADSQVASIKEKGTGRELVARPAPFFHATFKDGAKVSSCGLRRTGDGLYEACFKGRNGGVTFTLAPFFGGWTFRIVKVSLDGLSKLRAGCLVPVCAQYTGYLANIASDDRSGLCMRGYSISAKNICMASCLGVDFSAVDGIEGQSFGLAAGPRGDLQGMLRAMTFEAGVPRSASGGAWSLGAEDNRSSYLIADGVKAANVDEWISILRRTGIGTFHIRGWWDSTGWYSVDTNRFPRELADLRDASMKAKAAGFRTSFHTLTDCIARNSPWIPTPAASNLIVCHSYTLARPIPADGDVSEIYVNEKPASDHGFDFALWSRGNTIRIGTEMFQYKDISFEPPYRFTGVSRRAFGTPAEAHPAGARADYLWCFFGHFLGEPGTPLTDELAGRIARIYHAGGFDQIYFDGADGLGRWPTKVNGLLRQLYSALATKGHPPHYEDSLWTSAAWWFHSRIGAWDYTRWWPKAFVDRHVRLVVAKARRDNFMEPNMGWWPVITGSVYDFGYMRDDVEYFGAKTAGLDASFSMVLHASMEKPLTIEQVRQVTQLGWYERPRFARAFSPEALRMMSEQGRNFRLRQDASGLWTLAETEVFAHRMGTPSDRSWRIESKGACKAALRVRALDAGAPYDGASGCVVLGAADAPKLAVSNAKGVAAKVGAGDGEHGPTLVLSARNIDAPRNGSWSAAVKTYPRPFLNLVKEAAGGKGQPLAIGAWVKGDGSGATLNMQLCSPRSVNSAISEHYVKLDFTGWRYHVFSIWREHDAGAAEEFTWPYMPANQANYPIYERPLAINSVEKAAVWLNGVKPGCTARVEVSGVKVMPLAKSPLARPVVSLNGKSFALPFDVKNDEFAELEDGFWTLYALNGEPSRRVKADGAAPELSAGGNEVTFASDNASARAEITVTGLSGKPMSAFKAEWTDETRRGMAYEAAWPEMWSPSRGMGDVPPVMVRPGEKARLAVEIVGPVDRPVLTLGGEKRAFPVSINKWEAIRMDDGVCWRVVNMGTHVVREEGRFEKPLPLFSGKVSVAMSSADAATAAVQIRIVKWYDGPSSNDVCSTPDGNPASCAEVRAVEGREPSLLPNGRKFRLVWHDEFDGDRLDESKWSYRTNFWGRRAHWFATPEDNAVEVKDGLCRLKLVKRPDGQFVSPQLQTGELMWDIPQEKEPKGFWPFPKRSRPKFMHRYGYYECRCRLQRKPGWWSAFWMQSPMQGCSLDPRRAGIEHDIMESFEPGRYIVHAFHYNGYGADYLRFNSHRAPYTPTPEGIDGKYIFKASTDEFHVFGMLWEPDGYTFFVDGRQSGFKVGGAEGEAVSQTEEFIIISTEAKNYRKNRMTGKAAPELEATAAAGDDFAVDYVRVYDICDAVLPCPRVTEQGK